MTTEAQQQPVAATGLTPKREVFAQSVAAGCTATEAFRRAFDVKPGTKPASVTRQAYEVLHRPDVAARVASLRVAISEAFVNNLANLRARQYEIATAEPLTEVRVFNCRRCRGTGHKYQWRDIDEYAEQAEQWAATLESKPSPQPSLAGGIGFDPFAPPNPECPECLGAGVPVVYLKDSTTLPPGRRASFRGAYVDRWGVIHVEQHDQQEAARELARMIPGAIAPQRSESKVAHLHVEPLRDLTPEQIVALMNEQKLIPNG